MRQSNNSKTIALDLTTKSLASHEGKIILFMDASEVEEYKKGLIPVKLTKKQLQVIKNQTIEY